MSYDIVPGECLPPAAPLRKVTRLSEEPTEAVAQWIHAFFQEQLAMLPGATRSRNATRRAVGYAAVG